MTIKILNFTSYPNLKYPAIDAEANFFNVFMAKGSFDVDLNKGKCEVSDEQEPINFTDLTYGDLSKSSLRHPSEFVPYKPETDIIIDAVAYAPGGKPAASWHISVRIFDEKGQFVYTILRVTGPRYWIPRWKRQLTDIEKADWKKHRNLFIGWELSDPEPISSLPVKYEYAYGGLIHKGLDENGDPIVAAYEYNPVGCGWIDPEWTDHTKPVPAPQIENFMEPLTDPYKQYNPAGLGPILSAWQPRRPLGGTYDKNWSENIWPDWPKDYKFAYNNSASPALKAQRFIQGDINIELVNLSKNKSRSYISFQDPVVYTSYKTEYGYIHIKMNIDTFHLDIGEHAADDPRLYVIWRTIFIEDVVSELQLVQGKGNYPDKALPYLRKTMEEIAGPQDIYGEEEV